MHTNKQTRALSQPDALNNQAQIFLDATWMATSIEVKPDKSEETNIK